MTSGLDRAAAPVANDQVDELEDTLDQICARCSTFMVVLFLIVFLIVGVGSLFFFVTHSTFSFSHEPSPHAIDRHVQLVHLYADIFVHLLWFLILSSVTAFAFWVVAQVLQVTLLLCLSLE